ncbi:MAG: shikimate kinase, partial [Candidatus Izemoplasmataceae bacterium]
HLNLVFDVIYNPLKTKLLLDAEKRDIKTLSGLSMLVTQALYSRQYFFNTNYHMSLLEETYKYILKLMLNITLIGLPFSGKTHYGKLLGNRYNKTFIDIDESIVKQTKMPIIQTFKKYGEPYFRSIETQMTKQMAKDLNQIISTGGGVIIKQTNVDALKQNSLIIYLDLSPSIMKTIKFHSRPHVNSYDDLIRLKENRHHLYKKSADIIIKKDTLDTNIIMKRIEVKLDEYINNQWAKSKPFRD